MHLNSEREDTVTGTRAKVLRGGGGGGGPEQRGMSHQFVSPGKGYVCIPWSQGRVGNR